MTLPEGKPLRLVFGETVTELAAKDPRIVVLDGDLGSSTQARISWPGLASSFFSSHNFR